MHVYIPKRGVSIDKSRDSMLCQKNLRLGEFCRQIPRSASLLFAHMCSSWAAESALFALSEIFSPLLSVANIVEAVVAGPVAKRSDASDTSSRSVIDRVRNR
jgi:hypothetical protein